MERLPLEMWWRIFDSVFDDDPAHLHRLRTVSTHWKALIDHVLFKKWHQICIRDIPEDRIDSLVAARFPMAASLWRDSHWKKIKLFHVPRGIYQAWRSLPQLVSKNFTLKKIPAVIIPRHRPEECKCENKFILDPVFAINDNYLAVMHESSTNELNTYIYDLTTNLPQLVRTYPFQCKSIDFYTVEDHHFIIFDVISSDTDKNSTSSRNKQTVYMSEFLKNHEVVHTKLWSGHYTIVENECFTYRGLHFEHNVFSIDHGFEKTTGAVVPKQNPSFKWAEISTLRMNGLELQVIIRIKAGEPDDEGDYNNVWIFKYNIEHDSNEKLKFTPHEQDFIQIVKEDNFSIVAESFMCKKLPLDIWIQLLRINFVKWFNRNFNHGFLSVFIYCNYVFFGTKNGNIYVLKRELDQILQDIARKPLGRATKYSCHSLNQEQIYQQVVPIGIVYTKSVQRLVVLHPRNIVCLDYPLIR